MIDLKTTLKQYPNCLNSRASFKSVLMDMYPNEKRAINILTILFECGIANKIKIKQSISANEMQGFITQVENEYGISAQYAQDAILVWASAFGVTASAVKTSSPTVLPRKTAPQVEHTPIAYVQGDVNDYDVEKKKDGYYIIRFNGFEEEEMTIPSMIDGKPIKGIGEGVFQGCASMKKVCISEGIEVIENGAFADIETLESVFLPETLRQIGGKGENWRGAFYGTKLKAVVIPQNTEVIGENTFAFTCLQKIDLPDKIAAIHSGAFRSCLFLSEIKFPSNLQTIKEEAFVDCDNLREIYLPTGMKSIGKYAFACTELTSVYIPPTVTNISDQAFGDLYGGRSRNLTIYCAAGSVALDYARKHNIKYARAQF